MIETTDLALVREALQSRLIVELMSNAMHKELTLKGGMAMRAVHGSVRHTKDIDLDADSHYSVERIRGIVRRSIDRAISSGLIEHPKVSEPKQTDTTQRWKIVGTKPGSQDPLNLTIEISRRPAPTHGHVMLVDMPSAFVGAETGVKLQVLDSQAIAVTKVLALTDTHRCAPRDLYDLFILIRAQTESPGHLLASIPNAHERLTNAMLELWPKIESMTYDQFNHEVMPFLHPSEGPRITEEDFDEMRMTVGSSVESWIQQALEDLTAAPPERPRC